MMKRDLNRRRKDDLSLVRKSKERKVIDACAKGNLGRFINHSCEPNCRIEKWMVNGEVCIGIFALRDIKKGEEVTFDYNYVRVFGAAAKKCVCGSSQCRGYIGGDPLNAEEIVQSDSDEEYPEPVMIRGNGNTNRNLRKTTSTTSSLNGKEIRTIKNLSKADNLMDGSVSVSGQHDISSEKHARELSHQRCNQKQKKLELNELLGSDGGISKRKDASRGYLKLLLLTATSGDSGHGEAIQSTRDLSMILDALLKTKSKTVLVDIINKNGLQMLHNIMKRYRKEFIKIPILRKLLKVIEYLAAREIITPELINGGPRCPGVESFRDSILSLTEHTDRQVHQIARNFRDRWFPRCFRKFGCIDRDNSQMEFHYGSNHDRSSSRNNWSDCAGVPSETLDCVAKPVVATSTVDSRMTDGSSGSRGTRKRKSRWDQPSKGIPDLGAETNTVGDGTHVDEDVPPGFSSPMNRPMLPSDAYISDIDHKKQRFGYTKRPYGMAMGHPQQRFISRLSVAFGVPISIVQQFGSSQAETSENWIVAPGMPFQPFPPLPPYPRENSAYSTVDQAAQKAEQDSLNRATLDLSQNPPTTSGSAVGMETLAAVNQSNFQRVRGSDNLARKYFRQQKGNSSMIGGYRTQKRNDWGPNENSTRNGMCQGILGSGPNKYNSSFRSEDISSNMQSGVTSHQHP